MKIIILRMDFNILTNNLQLYEQQLLHAMDRLIHRNLDKHHQVQEELPAMDICLKERLIKVHRLISSSNWYLVGIPLTALTTH